MTENPFLEIPHSPRNNLTLYFYTAVLKLIVYLRDLHGDEGLEKIIEDKPFLGAYFSEACQWMPGDLTWADAFDWWCEHIEYWEGESTRLPIPSLKKHLDLDFDQLVVLTLAGMVEDDSRFGSLFAELQKPLSVRRPTLDLLINLVPEHGAAVLLDAGLLVVDDPRSPRAEWEARVPLPTWSQLRGETLPREDTIQQPETASGIDTLILAENWRRELARLPALLESGEIEIFVLRGMPGGDRARVMSAVAAARGLGVLPIETEKHEHVGPFCAMSGAMPVFIRDLSPGETFELPKIAGFRGPIGVLTGLEGGFDANRKTLILTLPFPGIEQRETLWREKLGDMVNEAPANSDQSADRTPNPECLARRYLIPEEHIRRTAAQAVLFARLEERDHILYDDVTRAHAQLNRQWLDKLAVRIETGSVRDHLILSPATDTMIDQMLTRCRHRETLADRLGPAFTATTNRGVRVLFAGGSGTGKTLAARILAAELGMDLYRVDLASVVNKYIGETEKNLHRILTFAEELDVLLLLDEGDALLGSRTEIRSANDRYANLETNYLLQRLEHYQGVLIITSNAREHIDRAFERRMDMVINFMPAQAEERLRIWRVHLPANHEITPSLLEEAALRCALSGGQIRNAALLATLSATDQNDTLSNQHLIAAIQNEYTKTGSISPLSTPNQNTGSPATQFLDLPN